MNPSPESTTTAWTGGQASLLRALAALALAVHVGRADAVPAAAGVLVAAALAVGLRQRAAAAAGLVVVALSAAMAAAPAGIGAAGLAWVLAILAWMPGEPYGSWDARGRTDPRGSWAMPPLAPTATGVVLALLAAAEAVALLPSGNTAAFAALAAAVAAAVLAVATGPTARTAWLVFVACELLLGVMAPPRAGLLLAALVAADPRWIRGVEAAGADIVFYDGECGLCHRTVRFFLAEDRDGARLRYAPLGGAAFEGFLARTGRAAGALPDSILVGTADGRLLLRSDAVAYLLSRLGGAWRVAAVLLTLVPRVLRDCAYDGVAAVRKRLFAKPEGACPILPPDLRARFDA